MNKEFWSGPGAPIFVYIGGEGQESCRHLSSSMFIHSLAEKHNALLIDVEHRFYGESYPTADMSTENLQYLSSSQALADLARVIGQVKSELGSGMLLVTIIIMQLCMSVCNLIILFI